jgi:AbrB family looped-hinge helix DNA binding protein
MTELKASLFGRIARQIAMLSLNDKTTLEEAYNLYASNLSDRMEKYKDDISKKQTKKSLLKVAMQKREELEDLDLYSDLRKTVALGRSLAITIPNSIIKKLNIKKGDKIYITLKDGDIILRTLPLN